MKSNLEEFFENLKDEDEDFGNVESFENPDVLKVEIAVNFLHAILDAVASQGRKQVFEKYSKESYRMDIKLTDIELPKDFESISISVDPSSYSEDVTTVTVHCILMPLK